MLKLLWIACLLLGPLAAAEAAQHAARQAACKNPVARKPWGMLTQAERTAYLKAELCLMAAPSKLDVNGAKTRWDDLQWNHIVQTHVIHDAGQFLPWHRNFLAVHGKILQDECNYTGPLPYWDETADSSLADITDSSIFQPDAFGGNGSGRERYITDGPFVNTTLRLRRMDLAPGSDYRISRSLSGWWLASAQASALNVCFQMTTYTAAWECWAGAPHSAGHGATGGLMIDVSASPGDPLFYLHHGWLDAMWWKWQSLDLPGRLADIGGRNLARQSYLTGIGIPFPGREWTDYLGDGGSNITTLNHVLYNAGLAPNVTVGDVMDPAGEAVCAEFFFSEDFNVTVSAVVDGMLTVATVE